MQIDGGKIILRIRRRAVATTGGGEHHLVSIDRATEFDGERNGVGRAAVKADNLIVGRTLDAAHHLRIINLLLHIGDDNLLNNNLVRIGKPINKIIDQRTRDLDTVQKHSNRLRLRFADSNRKPPPAVLFLQNKTVSICVIMQWRNRHH